MLARRIAVLAEQQASLPACPPFPFAALSSPEACVAQALCEAGLAVGLAGSAAPLRPLPNPCREMLRSLT